MPQLPPPDSGHGWARLEGGPLDGVAALVPLETYGTVAVAASMVGFPNVPVLDEDTETLEWRDVSYLRAAGQPIPPRAGEVWQYSCAPPVDDG